MRVKFSSVLGECLLMDGYSCQEPYSGMSWSGSGPCVLATGPSGKAIVWIGSERVDVGPNSWLKIQNSPGSVRRFISSGGRDFRLLVGRLWSQVHDDRGWDQDGGGVAGVRG
jgi:hypothetical protein